MRPHACEQKNESLKVRSTYDFALSLLVPLLSPPAEHVDVHVSLVVGRLVRVHVLVVQLLLHGLDRLNPGAPEGKQTKKVTSMSTLGTIRQHQPEYEGHERGSYTFFRLHG